MSYQQFLIEDIRLVILRLLNEMQGYTTNSSVLVTGLASIGHQVSRDTVKTQINWLAEQGLVTYEAVHDIYVVTLTERGQDVATGKAKVHGIQRPRAGA